MRAVVSLDVDGQLVSLIDGSYFARWVFTVRSRLMSRTCKVIDGAFYFMFSGRLGARSDIFSFATPTDAGG